MSWDNLRLIEGNDRAHSEIDEINKIILRLFSSRDGSRVLEYFKNKTLDQPSFHPGEDPSYGYLREGQNSVWREVLHRMESARNIK